MIIDFMQFGGISPRYDARRLPKPYAVIADDCKMDRGQLRGFGGSEEVFESTPILSGVESLHIYTPDSIDYLLQWPYKVSVVDNANVSDSYKRIYWTAESSSPQMGAKDDIISGAAPYPTNSYDLGVPVPLGLVQVARVITADSPSVDDIEAGTVLPVFRAYTYTFVSHYGEESPPYTPSDGSDLPSVEVYEGDEVTISGMAAVPAGNHAFDSLKGAKKRVYQTDISGNYRRVAEIDLTTAEITISPTDFDSAIVMETDILVGSLPPEELQGLVLNPNGYLLGFVGNTLYASSLYLFHNWPVSNRQAVAYDVLGLVVVSQGVLVITTGGLYAAIGKDPSNIDVVKINDSLGCVSAESIVDMGGYALYASSNGIVYGSTSEATIVTSDVILENDWPSYDPESMVGYRHLQRYIVVGGTENFILNPKGTSDRLVNSSIDISAGFTSKEDGHLYYVESSFDGLNRFDSDPENPIPYKWTSATYISKMPTVVSCFRIDADDYDDLTLQVYMDGNPLYDNEGIVIDSQYVDPVYSNLMLGRLPEYPKAKDIVLELSGTSAVNSVLFSDSFGELISG